MTTNVNLGFVAAAGGTVDAITATYSPAPAALVDKMLLWFRATGANTSTTPTFSPNGLIARTIVKNGGQALFAGDIPAAGAIVGVVYDLANTGWEIIGVIKNSGWVDNGTSVVLQTITDNVGIGVASPTVKLIVQTNDGSGTLFLTESGGGHFEHSATDLMVNSSTITNDATSGFSVNSSGCPIILTSDIEIRLSDKALFDGNSTANQTRFLVYDVQTATLQRVKVGANGSGPGGIGRALYIDNS